MPRLFLLAAFMAAFFMPAHAFEKGEVWAVKWACAQEDASLSLAEAAKESKEAANYVSGILTMSGICFQHPAGVPVQMVERLKTFKDKGTGRIIEVWKVEVYPTPFYTPIEIPLYIHITADNPSTRKGSF